MRLTLVFRYVGFILLLNSFFLLLSAGVSYYYQDGAFFLLLYSAIMAFLFGIFPLIFVPPAENINNSEGLVIVVASWLLSCLIGMIPYLMWGGEFSFTNAWFESVSGYTTTGSTILADIEAIPKSILFWRASTHWMGGVGIIIFVLSVLPSMGIAGLILYRAEMTTAAINQFKLRARESVKIILYVYIGLTFLETISLIFAGLSLYEAVTHSFATIATGGFSTKNLSIASFNSVTVEVVIMVFMIFAGTNFTLLYAAIIGRFSALFKNTALKYYLLANFIGISFVTINNLGTMFDSLGESLRYSSFQILSVGTSTGFATADSSIWPYFSQLIIIFFTLQCASAGSTSGGIKVDRVMIVFKSITRRLKKVMYPNAVIPIYLNKESVEESAVEGTILYVIFYMMIIFISTLALTYFDVDIMAAFSGSAACMGNVGPGMSTVGSLENYASIPNMGKLVLTLTMLLGRLEIYGFIIFFIPKTWKK